jgi:hypothetical protein
MPEHESNVTEASKRALEVRAAVDGGVARGPRALVLGAALLALAYLALLFFLPVAEAVRGSAPPHATPLLRFVAFAHVLVVSAGYLLLLVEGGFAGAARAERLPRGPLARRAYAQVLFGLGLLAAAWGQLYLWLFSIWSEAGVLGAWAAGPKGLALADAWNTLASFAFFYLYLVLDLPSVRSEEDAGRATPFRRSLAGVGLLCGAVAVLALLGRHGWLGLERLGPLSGSLLAAVSMMYFFGKFDYRFMRVPRPLIAPLYVYVAIQIAWHEIAPGDATFAEGLFVAALLLKAYLFALLWVWLRKRTLQRYLDFAAL